MGRPDVIIVSQIGREIVPGTAVAADRLLPTVSFMPKLKRETKQFRAQGGKYQTASVRHKQYAAGTYDGITDYNSIQYILNGLLPPVHSPVAIAASTGFTWNYLPLSRQLDNPDTYTIEVGDAVAVDQFAYGQLTSLTAAIGQDDIKINGNLIAQTMTPNLTQTAVLNQIDTVTIPTNNTGGSFTLTYSGQTTAAIPYNATADNVYGALVALTNIGANDIGVTGGPGATAAFTIEFKGALGGASRTLTSTPSLTGGTNTATVAVVQAGGGTGVTMIAERPVERGQVDVFLDTTFGGIGGTQITDPFEEEIQLGDKFKPKFIHNSTYKSFKEAIEVAPSLVFSFTQEHNAQSRALLANILTNDPVYYMRIRMKGLDLSNAVDGSVTELVQFDLAGKFTEPEPIPDVTNSGVFGYKFHLVALDDPTMGRPWSALVQNSRATL